MDKERLFKGIIIDNLPEKVRSEVRIFLSSTFKDFQIERNFIIENIYDKLRNELQHKYEKDFFLIDLRWGVTDEMTDQQISTDVCLHEIEKCKKQSFGPNFLVMMSHRYGSQLLKSKIEKEEFEKIRNELTLLKNDEAVKLMETCYQLDRNGVNRKEYKLKSIKTITAELKITENEWWSVTSPLLMRYFRETMERLSIKENSDDDISVKESYYHSVTHTEIEHALKMKDNSIEWTSTRDLNSLVFIRTIEKIDVDGYTDEVKAFKDKDDAEKRLNKLKEGIENLFKNDDNKYSYKIDWKEANHFTIDPTKPNKYLNEKLKEFGENFYSKIIKLFEKNVEKSTQNEQYNDDVSDEVLHHATFCNRLDKQKQIILRETLIGEIKKYLADDWQRPLIIYGKPGSGKSTILAYTIKNLREADDVFIYRFMGTSRKCSNMKSIFKSVLKQLDFLYPTIKDENDQVEENNNEKLAENLKEKFLNRLNKISELLDKKKKLVFIFDSIDQLSSYDYGLKWFINELPKHVKIIYSVIPEHPAPILFRLRDCVAKDARYLEIPKLNRNEAIKMIENLMNEAGRTLTGSIRDEVLQDASQWLSVDNLFKQIEAKKDPIYPLHIKILFDIVKKWPSWYTVDAKSCFHTLTSTNTAIKTLFCELEALYNRVLFERCIFYLTLFEYNGISEKELEDILSLDDEVLNNVYVYFHPPVRRFQISLWLKIKYELREYITNKESDGVGVICWFHRCFIEAAKDYYSEIFKPSAAKDVLLTHAIDFFTEKYKSTEKEFENNNKMIDLSIFTEIKKTKDENKYTAVRRTSVQKIKYESGKYNKRKLNELVQLISMLQNTTDKVNRLKEHIYFNYEFMHAKCTLNEFEFLFNVQNDINKMMQLKLDKDVAGELHELHEMVIVITKTHPKLKQSPDLLYFETLSRLERRSKHTNEFQKVCGLEMISKNIETVENTDVFIVDSSTHSFINKFHSQYDGPFIFVESSETRGKGATRLHIVHYVTTNVVKCIEFDTPASNIQILMDGENDEIVDKDLYIYYSSGKSLNCWNGHCSRLREQDYDEEIKHLLLLNPSVLLVVFENKFRIFDIDGKCDHEDSAVNFENDILFVESTIPKETVFNPVFYQSLSSITVIFGLNKTKKINLYCFKNEFAWVGLSFLAEIDNKNWIEKSKELKSLIIDHTFMSVNSHRNNETDVFFRFAVQEIETVNNDAKKTTIHIIETDKNLKTIFKQIKEYEFAIELAGFINNNVILKFSYQIYVHNLDDEYIRFEEVTENEEVRLVETRGYKNLMLRCQASMVYIFDDEVLLIQQTYNEMSVYRIDYKDIQREEEYRTDKLPIIIFTTETSTKSEINHIRGEFKIKKKKNLFEDGKLLRINPVNRQSIIEYNFSKKKLEENFCGEVVWNGILCSLDHKHVLLQTERDGNFEITIYDVIDQKPVYVIGLEVRSSVVEIIGCNKRFLVVLNWPQRRIIIYEILKKANMLIIDVFGETPITEDVYVMSNVTKCHFNEFDTNQFILTMYNKTKKKIFAKEIRGNVEGMPPTPSNEQNPLDINCDTEQPLREVFLVTTCLNKCFILCEKKSEKIHTNFCLLGEFEIENLVESIECVPNSDDLIVKCVKDKHKYLLYYVQMDFETLNPNLYLLKDFDTDDFGMKIEKDFLFLWLSNKDLMEIYKIDEIKSTFMLPNNAIITINKTVNWSKNIVVSDDNQYLVIGNHSKELCVYRLNDMTQLACLQLNDWIGGFALNGPYITLRLDQKSSLITFKIIE